MPALPSAILAPTGPVALQLEAALGGYESRPEQVRMAEAVAAALDGRRTLLVEAGTGVGKSFAYLVPAILRCLLRGEKVVVATATISLQEQLVNKDIPLLVQTIERWNLAREDGLKVPPLVPVLAKGRGNYLSIRRLKMASQRQERLLDPEQRASLHVIEDWAYTTKEGSLSTLPAISRPEVWDHTRSDSDNCMGRKCPHYKECFYQNARRELERANLIICNHALFFSDLAMRTRGMGGGGSGGGGVLPAYDHVILDEAHNIEDAACEHFGLSLAQARVSRLLRTLYQPRKQKGYLFEQSLALADPEGVERACMLCERAEIAGRKFFDDLLAWAEEHKESSGRLRRAAIVENDLSPALHDLALRLRSLRDALEHEPDRYELGSYARRATEIADTAEALIDQTLDGYVYWVEVESRGSGAFSHLGPRVTLACAPVEVGPILRRVLFSPPARESPADDLPPADAGDEMDAAISALAAEEADSPALAEPSAPGAEGGTGGEIRPIVDKPAPPRPGIVLTSATLATRTHRQSEGPLHPEHAEAAFAHIMTTLGIDDARTLQLGSPFDYARQAKVVVDLTMPSPSGSGGAASGSGSSGSGSAERRGAGRTRSGPGREPQEAYIPALSARILHHAKATRGGAFVLFTSFATMHAVAQHAREGLEDAGMPLFVQSGGSGGSGGDRKTGSRQFILKQFLENDHAVLFGAASFWQGVDVRGERLRNVIITRLPFEPPDRPLTQARLEKIEYAGGNPFMQDSLPRAIIRFKQGFGRLIRSKTDKGQVVILDPRIRTARYGKMFLEALPEGVRVEEVRGVEEWEDF